MTPQTAQELEDVLIGIGQRIDSESPDRLRHPDQRTMTEWRGADVRVTSDFEWEPEDSMATHDLTVRTRHAGVLTWLFFELRDAFSNWLDAENKYGFYGSIANGANQHLGANQPEPDDYRPLLRAVLAVGFRWQQVLKDDGELPADAPIVLHTRDAEGRQRRVDLESNEDIP